MSDYGDFCREMREARKQYRNEHMTEKDLDLLHEQAHNEWYNAEVKHIKKVSQEYANKFIEKLLSLGAVFKTDGVYRLGRFDFYPRKSNARAYRTNEFFEQEEALNVSLKEVR